MQAAGAPPVHLSLPCTSTRPAATPMGGATTPVHVEHRMSVKPHKVHLLTMTAMTYQPHDTLDHPREDTCIARVAHCPHLDKDMYVLSWLQFWHVSAAQRCIIYHLRVSTGPTLLGNAISVWRTCPCNNSSPIMRCRHTRSVPASHKHGTRCCMAWQEPGLGAGCCALAECPLGASSWLTRDLLLCCKVGAVLHRPVPLRAGQQREGPACQQAATVLPRAIWLQRHTADIAGATTHTVYRTCRL